MLIPGFSYHRETVSQWQLSDRVDEIYTQVVHETARCPQGFGSADEFE